MPITNPNRRLALSVLAATLLGALTTIAIAWVLAGTTDSVMHPGAITFRRMPSEIWTVQEYPCFGTQCESWTPFEWIGEGQTAAANLAAIEATLRNTSAVWSGAMPRVVETAVLTDAPYSPPLSR